jgi:hypothetical protein
MNEKAMAAMPNHIAQQPTDLMENHEKTMAIIANSIHQPHTIPIHCI